MIVKLNPDEITVCQMLGRMRSLIARSANVRLSMHPGQFTVLASENPGIVDRSIEEFEYHADMARFMGYGKTFQDFKINVHISGKQGPDGIHSSYQRLSPEARNCITIENEENSWGLDDCLKLQDLLPIVLDVHHYWIREGEYLSEKDHKVRQVINSWRGVTPVLHYSISREELLFEKYGENGGAPFMESLLKQGFKKQKLRAHSDFFWNKNINRYVLSFWNRFDIMCESKGKNLASQKLYNFAMTEW